MSDSTVPSASAVAAPSIASPSTVSPPASSSTSPAVYTIILFYLYTPVPSPLSIALEWQRALCKRLQLKGRVRLAHEGINATLAGRKEDIEAYIEAMNQQNPYDCTDAASSSPSSSPLSSSPLFGGIVYKFSTSLSAPFPTLTMYEVEEITVTGKMSKSKPGRLGQKGEGKAVESASASPASASASAAPHGSTSLHLTPSQFHSALDSFDPSTTVLLDVRNAYETAIGSFTQATDPKLRAFHALPEYINQNLDALRGKKKIMMYCTGGIRCEKASLYVKHRVPTAEVVQLEGGIHKYLDEFPDGGHFKGKNFVFDARLAMASGDQTIVGKCVQCADRWDEQKEEVLCAVCRCFVILCPKCKQTYESKGWRIYCSEHILLAAAPKEIQAATAVKGEKQTAKPATSSSAVPVVSAAVAPVEDGEGDAEAEIPSSDLGCEEQWHSFLSRFTTEQLQAQLAEINAILAYFQSPKQRKAASKSRKRKQNLFAQKRRLEVYLQGRLQAEQGQTKAEGEENSATSPPAVAASTLPKPPELLSFVPFLNV